MVLIGRPNCQSITSIRRVGLGYCPRSSPPSDNGIPEYAPSSSDDGNYYVWSRSLRGSKGGEELLDRLKDYQYRRISGPSRTPRVIYISPLWRGEQDNTMQAQTDPAGERS